MADRTRRLDELAASAGSPSAAQQAGLAVSRALPLADPTTMPRAAHMAATAVASRAVPKIQQIGSDFGRGLAGHTQPAPARTAAAHAPAAASATGSPGTAPARTLDAPRPDFGNVQGVASGIAPAPLGNNSYVDANNQTRTLTAAQAAPDTRPAPVYAAPSTAPAVQAATQRALGGQRDATRTARADAAEMLNPMSAGAEIMRRLENSQRSYFNKGSPSARASQAQAYMGQLAAMNAASAAGQGAANATLQAGAAGEGQAAEAAARRSLDADQFNVEASQAHRRTELEARSPSNLGMLRGLDGTTSFVRNDGSTQTLRDEAGNPIQAAAEGGVTPRDLFNARNAEIKAVLENAMIPAEERQSTIDAINARYEALGGGQRAAPPAGTVRGGYRFKGGDPASKDNWEKVSG